MIAEEKQKREIKRETIMRFLSDIGQQDGLLAEFDEELWYATAQHITVHSEKNVTITFKDGSIISGDAKS